MIAESLQNTISNMRQLLSRNNGDYEALAGFFLDSLEADVERVAGLENSIVLTCETMPGAMGAQKAGEKVTQ